MTIATAMVSCPGHRDKIREETIARLAETDWNDEPRVFATCRDDYYHGIHDAHLALQWFLTETNSDFLLFIEDDIIFNRHLRWNIEHWSPILDGTLVLGSLYNPQHHNVDGILDSKHPDYYLKSGICWGCQAYLLSRDAVSTVLSLWNTNPFPWVDYRITEAISSRGHLFHYHKPSLVEHRESESLVGNKSHRSIDFDPTWKS